MPLQYPPSYKTDLDGTPNPIEIATTEKVPLGFDFSANVGQGESLANFSSVMTDLGTNLTVALGSTPTLSGVSNTTLIQEVLGSLLTPLHQYRLVVSADLIGVVTGKRLSVSVIVQVPY